MSRSHEPWPILRELFEAIAAIMEIDEGEELLELHFRDGYLTAWWRHDRRNRPLGLGRYDGRAA